MKWLLSLLLLFTLTARAQYITRLQLVPVSNYVLYVDNRLITASNVFEVYFENLTNVGSGLIWTGNQLIATNQGVAGTNGGTLSMVKTNSVLVNAAAQTLEFTNTVDIKWQGIAAGSTARISALINQSTGSGAIVKSNAPTMFDVTLDGLNQTTIKSHGATLAIFGAPFGPVSRINLPQLAAASIAYIDTDQNLTTLLIGDGLTLDTNFVATLSASASIVSLITNGALAGNIAKYLEFTNTFDVGWSAISNNATTVRVFSYVTNTTGSGGIVRSNAATMNNLKLVNVTPSSIVRVDASSIVAPVTVGTGLTFDGTTLSATAVASTNNAGFGLVDLTQFVTNGNVLRIKQDSFQTNNVFFSGGRTWAQSNNGPVVVNATNVNNVDTLTLLGRSLSTGGNRLRIATDMDSAGELDNSLLFDFNGLGNTAFGINTSSNLLAINFTTGTSGNNNTVPKALYIVRDLPSLTLGVAFAGITNAATNTYFGLVDEVNGNFAISNKTGVTRMVTSNSIASAIYHTVGGLGLGTNNPAYLLDVIGDNTRNYLARFGTTNNPNLFRFHTNGTLEAAATLTLKPGTGGNVQINTTGIGTGIELGSGGPKLMAGAGAPETFVTAPVGSIYVDVNGTPGNTLYIKESGTGNVGWTAK